MTKEEVVTKLIEDAAIVYKADASVLSADTDISETLGTNSLNRMGMCAMVENHFDVVIPLAEFGKYKTFKDLADMIAEQDA